MINVYLTAFLLFLFGFITLFIIFTKSYKAIPENINNVKIIPPFIYLWSIFAAAGIGSYFLTDLSDFITPMSFHRVWIPLGLALVIYYGELLLSPVLSSLIIIGCVVIDVLLQPLNQAYIFTDIPLWAIQLILIVSGSIFCIFYNILNITPKVLALSSIITLGGVVILGFCNAAPIYSTYSAAILIGLLLVFFRYDDNSDHLTFDKASCSAIAFLICQLLFLQTGEFSLASCAIFTSIFWAEFLTALWNKCIYFHSGRLYENTTYYQMTQKYSQHLISMIIGRVGCLTLFLGWLQLFSLKNNALIMVSIAATLWLNHSSANPGEHKTLRQVNSDFLNDLKQNIQETKEIIQQQKEKKD